MDQAEWDERYGSREPVWSGRANGTLVAQVSGLTPGRALEAAAGEGADAIWLAEHGWQVTALDFSAVGLARAAAAAAERGLGDAIRWVHADLLDWTPDEPPYDLVTSHYLHLPSEPRGRIYATIAAAVAPGGRLLVVGHHPSDLELGVNRPPDPDRFFTAEQLAADLGTGWIVEQALAAPRPATHPEGHEVTIHDTVLLARRA
ncbi:MAG: class I SAM-dependent methyltransferase [Actinobacteria bacterium]|nr:class I SAM-dependent methyltransferase [Actinomycetota bacterium]